MESPNTIYNQVGYQYRLGIAGDGVKEGCKNLMLFTLNKDAGNITDGISNIRCFDNLTNSAFSIFDVIFYNGDIETSIGVTSGIGDSIYRFNVWSTNNEISKTTPNPGYWSGLRIF